MNVVQMPERDEKTGRYSQTYTQRDFLDVIRKGEDLMTTKEVAKAVGCGHDTAYKRLQKLEAENIVSSRKVGNTLLWVLSE